MVAPSGNRLREAANTTIAPTCACAKHAPHQQCTRSEHAWGLAIDRPMGSHMALWCGGVVWDAVWWVAPADWLELAQSAIELHKADLAQGEKIGVALIAPHVAHTSYGMQRTIPSFQTCRVWHP